MKKIIASGKNLKAAILQGLNTLQATEDQVEYVVKVEAGFLRSCKIEMWKKPTEGERYCSFLQTVLDKAGFDATVEMTEDEKTVNLNIISAKSGDIIGRRGDTLESLRFLTAISIPAEESQKQVIVDCNDYRQKRVETLQKLAKNLEQKVKRTGKRVRLEPMNAYERRIIHTTLKQSDLVETFSEGAEPKRYIVIQKKYKHEDEYNSESNTTLSSQTQDRKGL